MAPASSGGGFSAAVGRSAAAAQREA